MGFSTGRAADLISAPRAVAARASVHNKLKRCVLSRGEAPRRDPPACRQSRSCPRSQPQPMHAQHTAQGTTMRRPNTAPADETSKDANAGIGHAQRELLNRTLSTWAWNKRFEDSQAEIAQHLADAYAEALEPLTPKQIGKIQGMQRVKLLRNFTLAAVARF